VGQEHQTQLQDLLYFTLVVVEVAVNLLALLEQEALVLVEMVELVLRQDQMEPPIEVVAVVEQGTQPQVAMALQV
jgi:hypothetical protein